MKLIQILADIICETLLDPVVLANARTREGAFTRNCKKLPYWTVMKLLMKNVKRSVSASLDHHTRLGGLWGLQIIAIDGSKIPLPNRKKLLEKYGSVGRGANSPTAIASVAYDVLNQRVLDAQFEPISMDERSLALRHMKNIKSKARTNL